MAPPLKEKSRRVRLVSLSVAMYRGRRGGSYRDRVVETACELDAAGELTIGDVFNAALGGSRLFVREFLGAVLLGCMAVLLLLPQVVPRSGVETGPNASAPQRNDLSTPVAYWTTVGSPGGCHATADSSKVLLTVFDETSHRTMTYRMTSSCSPYFNALR